MAHQIFNFEYLKENRLHNIAVVAKKVKTALKYCRKHYSKEVIFKQKKSVAATTNS